MAGARVTDLTGSPALGALTKIAPDIAMTAVGGVPSAPVKALANWGRRELMGMAMKTKGVPLKEAREAVDTMLKHDINVSQGGFEKLQGMIRGLETSIDEAVHKSVLSGRRSVEAGNIKSEINEYLKHVTDPNDKKAIERMWDRYSRHYFKDGKMATTKAHALKQDLYKEMSDSAFKLARRGGTDPETTGRAAIASGLRKETIRDVPEIEGMLNQQ